MIWPQFPTKVLQIMTVIGQMSLHIKNDLQNRVHLNIIKYMTLSIQNTSKRKRRKISNFFKNDAEMKVSRHLTQSSYPSAGVGQAFYFEHKYIIKLSKKDLFPHQLNLMLNSDQGLVLFRQTQTLSRHKQGSQQGFLSTMFPFSTLTEIPGI